MYCKKNKEKRKVTIMQKVGKKLYADIILILLLLILALSVFIIMRIFSVEAAFAVVTVDGVEVGRYSLKNDGEYSLNGGTNILVVRDGECYMKEADCPDKVCVHSGHKSLSGERIVCLPNRVEVYLSRGDEDGIL